MHSYYAVDNVENKEETKKVDFYLDRKPPSFEASIIGDQHVKGEKIFVSQRSKVNLTANDEQVPEIAELLLFFSARSFHVSNTIIPALQNGKSVICDRFNDATIAYQGNGRGFDISQINMLSSWVLTDLKPDITILLDAPADIGMQRTMTRGYSDRMESEDISFYERVRKGYLNLANDEPNRFRVIDATQSLQEVQADIKSHLDSLFQIA